jgi:hypothetical protein
MGFETAFSLQASLVCQVSEGRLPIRRCWNDSTFLEAKASRAAIPCFLSVISGIGCMGMEVLRRFGSFY